MKKYFTYFIFTLLLSAFGFSLFAQSSGGAFQYFPKDVQKAEIKRINKLNGTKLKSGAANKIDCLVPSVCESSAIIELVKNASWSLQPASLTWYAKKVIGNDFINGIITEDFPVGTTIVTKDPFTGKWYFNPASIPASEDGQFVQIGAKFLDTFGFPTDVPDVVFHRKLPVDIVFVATTSSMCDGQPINVSLVTSTAAVGPNTVFPTIVTTTNYLLYKDGIPTGDVIEGTGSQIDFPVTEAGVYTIKAQVVPDPVRGPTDICETTMSGSTTVTVNPLPDINVAQSNSPLCSGQTLNLTGSTATVPSTFVWSDANGWSAAGGTVSRPAITTAQGGFYTLTATTANSCVDDSVILVVVNPLPIITLTGPAAPCVTSTGNVYATEAGMTNYVWVVPAGATVTAGGTATDNTITITWATSGAKNLTVNYTDINSCGATTPTSLAIDVKPLPVVTLTGANTGCVNVSQTFTTELGMSNYTWSYPGATLVSGGTITDNTITLSWATSGAKSLNVTYTNANGCSPAAPTTKNITINNIPTPTITGPSPVCAGSTQTYTTESGAGISGWIWTVSGGTFVGPSNTASVQVHWNDNSAPTTGVLTVNYLNANNCTAPTPTTLNVTLNAQPNVTIAGPTPVCRGSVGNVYTTEAGMSAYLWTVSAGGTITAGAGTNSITVSWTTTGAKTVSVNYTAVNSCTATTPTSFPVTVQADPVPTITGTASACINSTGNIYTTEIGMGSYVWNITGGVINSGAGTNSVSVTWNTLGAQTISVNYNNALGCPAATPTNKSVTVNSLPVPTITGSATSCANTTKTYTTEGSMSGYLWSVVGGVIQSGQGTNSATILWGVANPLASVSVTYVNSNNCSPVAPTVLNVVVSAVNVPTLTGANSVCVNSTGNVYTTEAGMSSYVWTVIGGTITAGGTAASTTATVTWNTSGAQSISVTYTNPSGCPSVTPTILPVTVNPLPVPVVTGPNNSCVGTTGVIYTTAAGMSAYNWTISAGGIITAGAGTNTITVTWNTLGAQFVRVGYTDTNSCAASTPTQYNVVVNSLPVPTITGLATACQGITSTYTTEASMSGYLWTVSAAGTIQSGQGTNSLTVLWNNAGAAENVSVTYSNGCAAGVPTVKPINVGATPTVTITGLNSGICQGQTNVTYSTEAGKSSYVWTIVGGNITSGLGTSSVQVTWTTAGAQSISVNYNDVNGCAAPTPTTLNVAVSNVPTPTITGTANVCQGAVNVLYSTETGGGINGYQWTISAGGQILSGLGTDQILVKWNNSGAQSVSVNYMNAAGCMAPLATSLPVTVNATPSPTITGAALACVGTTKNYTTEAGFVNYVWSVSANGSIISGQGTNSVQIQWTTVGAENVSVNYNDALGCVPVAPTSLGVNVVALPVISLGGSVNACTNSTVQYSAPAGMTNYQWVVTGGTTVSFGSATDNVVDVLWPATAGVGSVSVNYTDANGCSASTPLVSNVTVGSSSTPSILGLASVCQGTTGVTYTTEAGMNGYVWTVSAGGNITAGAGTNSITIDWIGSGAQTVSVNYTNPSGCPVLGPIIQNVTVNALPINETITGSANACLNGTSTYSIPAGYSNIVWTASANGAIVGVNNASTVQVLWSGLGAGTVSVTYSSGSGCLPLSTPSKAITVNALPIPTITGVNTSCNGTSGVIYTTEAGMSNYSWIISGGSILSGANSNAVTVVWNVAGTGSISVNYDNASGCNAASPTLLNVTVTPTPTPVIAGSPQACINEVGVIYNTASGAGISNYVWTISGGTITSGLGTNQITVTWTSTLNSWISVAYDENGCTGNSGQYNVTVNSLPIAQTAVTNPATGVYCAGGPGVSVILTASEPTVSYELRDALNTLIGTVAAGTTPVVWNNVLAGTYSIIGIGSAPSSCSSIVTPTITVTSTPLPLLHSMIPTGTVVGCNGGLGYEITLGTSTLGDTYQLLLNGSPTGVAVPGTGGLITFGNQFSFGTYTVQASNSVTTCTQIMKGTFVMNPDAATTIYNVTSDPATGDFCNLPLNGVEVRLSGSDNGVSYILRTGAIDVETILGTGSPIAFTRIPTAGTYFVEVLTASGCRAPMNGSVTINPVTPPTAFNVLADNSGFYCAGDAGVGIRISGQELGVVYSLYEGVNPIPLDTKIGVVTNFTLPLDFTGLFGAGTYFVQASNSLVPGCMVAMTNNVTVSANALPVQYIVTSDGNICSGGTTNLNLSSSEVTAQYHWINLIDNSISAPINGTGSAISFPITLAGDYSIVSSITNNGITCTSSMNDTISVAVQTLPSDVSLTTTGGTGCNDGVVITISNSEPGVTYSALDQATLLSPIPSIVGNGLDISFDPIVDNGKVYIVEASLGGCPRIVGVPVNVNVSGVVIKQTVTGGGAICSGVSATIGLGDTEVGVQYFLFLADSPGGVSSNPAVASLVGDGLAKNFGTSITINGEYFVVGSTIGCSNEMSNRVSVSLNPSVVGSISVAPSTNVCINTPVVFTGTGGDQYTFYLNNVSLGLAPGATLNLPNVNNGDQVKVLVVNSVTGCSNLTLPITMSVSAELNQFSLLSVSNGSICSAVTDSLYLSGSDWGVDYVLFDGTDTPIDTISGNNGIIYYTNIIPGTYYVVAETAGGSPCGPKAMNDTITVSVAVTPTLYNQTPTGVESGCLGGTIDLDGSDIGVSYQLLRNGTTIIATQLGTGSAISFAKPLVAGTYTIQAIYGNGCIQVMNGTLDISNPVTENIYVLNALPIDGKYCNNGSNLGVTLTLSNSDLGKTYSLFNGVTLVDDTVSIGGQIVFGTFPTAGFYSVQVAATNGCFDIMDSVVHIQPIAPPTVFALNADDNGFYCLNGGVGVGIQLVGQQLNVNYDLYLGGIKVGEAVGIDDNPITPLPFMNLLNSSYRFTNQGTYSVTASYTTPLGCDVNMANSVTVTPSPDPTSFLVTSTGDFCEGSSTTINLNGSDVNVDYRWVNIITTDAGPWTPGTGGLVQFTGINISGDYVIEAQNNSGPSCAASMSDTISIVEVKLPLNRNFTIEDGLDCSTPTKVIVENAEAGVTYTLVDVATDTPSSVFFVGTTNLLDTMYISDNNGLYYISASRGGCPTRITPDVPINTVGAIKKQIVTPVDASICNGDLGVKFGLAARSAGVNYYLYRSLDNIKDLQPIDELVDSIKSTAAMTVLQFKKLGKKAGIYYVLGIEPLSGCTNFMINEPELIVNPLPTAFQMTGSGLYCDPINGANIGLEKQEDRVLYTLQQHTESGNYVDDVAPDFRGSLSGLPFSFGTFIEQGVNNLYKVVAIDTLTGCTSNMNGTVLVQQTPFTPIAPVVALDGKALASIGKYCTGTNGVEVKVIAPEPGITYQVYKVQLPSDTVMIERVASSTTDLGLGYYDLGTYYVHASWGGDACIQPSSTFDIIPRDPGVFNLDYDCHASPTDLNILAGGYISLDSSEVNITYRLYNINSTTDTILVGFKTGNDLAFEFDGIYGPGTYFANATCSPSAPAVEMANNIILEMPVNTYDVSISNRNALLGIRGDTVLQYGSQLDFNYYLRLNNWVDTFAIGSGIPDPPLEFPTDSSGIYNILAISDKNCGAIIDKNITIMETLLIAVNDTLRFSDKALTDSIYVGSNDIIDRANVDKDVVFKVVTSGFNPNFVLDSVTGKLTYNKPPSFFGKDSIRYEVRNVNIPNRADTAMIWIYIGNVVSPGGNFLIPNAFSPNNDGVNDKYVIQTVYSGLVTTESELEVYNRWGSVVYRSKDENYRNDWDGTTNTGMLAIGSELPNGTYFFIFKVTFNVGGVLKKEEYNGYIELRR